RVERRSAADPGDAVIPDWLAPHLVVTDPD
ncbi:MAG: hypothetical protein RIR59_587, partial [Pseudomonadota bacterium]